METYETQTNHVLSQEGLTDYQQKIYDQVIKSLSGAIRMLILHAKETSLVKFVSLLEEKKSYNEHFVIVAFQCCWMVQQRKYTQYALFIRREAVLASRL